MIRNNIFNPSRNLRDAGAYRLGLRNSTLETQTRRDLESLFLSERLNFANLKFYGLNARNIISATDLSFNYKNFTFFMHYNHKNLTVFNNLLLNIVKRNEFYFKTLQRDVKKIQDQIVESNISLNSKFNKVRVNSLFKEKDFRESYDLLDLKTNKTLLKSQRLSFKNDCLRLQEYFNYKVNTLRAEVIWEKSFFGDKSKPIEVSEDASLLHREGKVFYWLVGKLASLDSGQVLPDRPVELAFVLHFDGPQAINQLFIEFASELPVNLKQLDYWADSAWVPLTNISVINENNRLQSYFNDEIETKKLKITLSQSKYFDTATFSSESQEKMESKKLINSSAVDFTDMLAEESIGKVYDLSVLEVIPYFTKYRDFGYYREADPVVVNKPLTFYIDATYLHEDSDCFLEKSAHVVLFGEEDFSAIKKQNLEYERTPRCNTIISIPNNTALEKELLIFNKDLAKCSFFPDILDYDNEKLSDRIKVYKDGTLLTIGNDYGLSLNELDSLITKDWSCSLIQSDYAEYISGLFYIKLLKLKDIDSAYTVEYRLSGEFFTDESKTITIKNGNVIFDKRFHSSVGFIRPRISLRSSSKNNDSSLIKNYKVMVEEIDDNEDFNLEYEDFLEFSSRSSTNVI